MRKVTVINDNWNFAMEGKEVSLVSIPHCYNSVDGQDGSKMYRGIGTYTKTIVFSEEDVKKHHYLEVGAAELKSEVRVNGKLLHTTNCGFSLYRVALDGAISAGENVFEIKVSNEINNLIYPAMADFSFYGGLYRDVKLISDDEIHFSEIDGSLDGIDVIPEVLDNGDGLLKANVRIANENERVSEIILAASILDPATSKVVASAENVVSQEQQEIAMTISKVHLWDGVEDPFLYDVAFELKDKAGNIYDKRILPIGFRTIVYTKEQGFLLNGKPCKLHGVAKHQDFGGLGNAITEKEMQKDLELILEMGANAVRCSHYQHCDRWYELCDRAGLLVWAEIPVISAVVQKEEADKNAFEQLELLVAQVRNHTSVFCYGVQNEVCMITKNSYTFDLVERLSKRTKELDATRMTAQANECGTEDDCTVLGATDILGYNLYYGWYYGTIPELQERLDNINRENPKKPIILTEYGVDTNPRFHSTEPKANDYSEEYQLLFSENAINAIEERPFMMGGFVWNMFDFGSASRDEGGEKGKNQKGLVTIDRKLKKDAFFLYKAHWAKEEFVYLAGRRFVNRVGDSTAITVLTNSKDEISLCVNGVVAATKKPEGAITVFENVGLADGENIIEVVVGTNKDTIRINKVEKEDSSYICPKKVEGENAINWFEGLDPETMARVEEKPLREEGFTLEDTVADIFDNEKAKAIFMKYLSPLTDNARFIPTAPMAVNRILEFSKALGIPKSIITACEQELNAIDK